MDSTQEYAECLEVVNRAWLAIITEYLAHYTQAKRGGTTGMKENPYRSPADNETAIYAELKKLNIPNIAGFTIE